MDILPEHAFYDVSMDICGGQWPRTKRRNKYMLVLVCNLSKWVNIFPLKSLKADEIADALVEYFCQVGVPKILRSDNMPSFRGDLMDALCKKLGIEHRLSVPFHFESHGSVERCQGTIETILRKFVQDNETDWDRWLPFLCHAIRDMPHATTGYSACEMVFGRPFRGLLQILRESWTDGDKLMKYKNVSTAEYMAKLTEKIESTIKLARENTAKAQAKTKRTYDKKSSRRELKPGELALVLMPTSGNKIYSVWQGPFRVSRKCENNNYELILGNRKAIFHINSLRRYYEREDDSDGVSSLMVLEDADDDEMRVIDAEIYGEQVADRKADTDSEQFAISNQLTDEQRAKFRNMLSEFPDVFCEQLGKTNVITHKIRVTDETPCYQTPFRIPEMLKKPVEEELTSMLQQGIIKRDDESSWNSPLIVLRKANGGLRLVNSFVGLNEKTITEPYLMTNLNELLSRAAGSQLISRIDLQKSFYQISLSPESQKYTAFTTDLGTFVYTVMPQGLKNAPGTCQKLLNIVLRGMHKFSGSLLDDIVIFDKDPETHMMHVRQVLERLRGSGLTANKAKCIFAENRLVILGHLLENGRIYPDPSKVKVLSEMAMPKTKRQLKSLLGLLSYFRDFLPHYADIAYPLSELTGKGKPDKLTWTSEQETAFQKLRTALISKPVLRPPDMSKPFQLWVDSSQVAISAILMQRDDNDADNIGHAICFSSRKLARREQNFATVEKELLALVYGLLKFKHYLYGTKVDIYSDHQPIKWMRSLVKHNSRIARWSLLIQDFDFEIHHVPGQKQIADALTRLDD